MMPMDLRGFKQFIIESLHLDGMTPEMIGDDQPLFGAGMGLDSVDALELVVALERRLSLKIPAHEIDRDAFTSPAAMFRFVERRLAGQAGRAG